MRRFKFVIELAPIEAATREEALKKACRILEHYAESNDGSEFLANSTPICVPEVSSSSPCGAEEQQRKAPPCGAEEQQR